MKKILLVASGGDAPGINDFIYHLWQAFKTKDIEFYYSPFGVRGLYEGAEKKIMIEDYDFLLELPSSIIGCGRFPEYKDNLEVRKTLAAKAKKYDHIVLLGGDGSLKMAQDLYSRGVDISYVPLTVDNDVEYTRQTLGFRTALNTVVESINRIYYSVKAHGYVALVEIMGRNCPDLTKLSLKLSHADIAVTNDPKKTPKEVAKEVLEIFQIKKTATVLIMEKMEYKIHDYAKAILDLGMQARPNILGHVQRGGKTNVGDKILAYKFAREIKGSIRNKESIAVGKNKVIKMGELNEK